MSEMNMRDISGPMNSLWSEFESCHANSPRGEFTEVFKRIPRGTA